MSPESQRPPFDVEVWLTESVLVHVTVVPTGISSAPGTNARSPRTSAPIGIVIADVGPFDTGAGAGVGDGVDGDE